MQLKIFEQDFSILKLSSLNGLSSLTGLYFLSRTEEEISLVCEAKEAPPSAIACSDGWRGFRIEGQLDFSLIGILARLTGILAENKIGVFVISTYDTDYVFVKKHTLQAAVDVLSSNGYAFCG